MLGEIDKNKKPLTPQIFLAKPDRTIIAKLSEAYYINREVMLLHLNSLEFRVPYEIYENHNLNRNHKIDLIKERYLLKVMLEHGEEWFRIVELKAEMDEESDFLSVFAYSLAFDLSNQSLREYSEESLNARQVLQEVLQNTNWSIGYLDADFELTYRDFEFSNNTVLDAVYKIAETYNAIIEWDTVNRKINFRKPELHGQNKGLRFSYGQYLRTLGRESDSKTMVTQLRAWGKDGLTIERVNPTGQNYIQDFSYFMYPFKRDNQKNTISSSYYMSDALCHAILDYEELVASKDNEFQLLLGEKEDLEIDLTNLETELYQLKNDEARSVDIMTLQQAHDEMFFHKFNYMGQNITRSNNLNPFNYYTVLCRVSETQGISVSMNGVVRNVVKNEWVQLGKIFSPSTNIVVSGSASNVEVFIQIAKITEEEYNEIGNEQEIMEKYGVYYNQERVQEKELEISALKGDIDIVDQNIRNLRQELSIESNFTEEQIDELKDFIIVQDFEDSLYISDEDLYEAATKKFEEIKRPQMLIEVDIINFLELVDEQHNWDKLVLGDEVTIVYEKIDTKVTAKIIGFSIDYEEGNITLTIANVKDIRDSDKKFEDFIYNGINTSVSLNYNKSRWDQALIDAGNVSNLINNFWNDITNEIDMASNETVVIDRRGITIFDDEDPNRFLRATHGILGITDDGGLTYKHAITYKGIIGERIYGKIITGVNLTIGDEDGILEILGNKGLITDRCLREVMKFGLYDTIEDKEKFGILLNRYEDDPECSEVITNQVIVDRDDGFRITRRSGNDWENVAWLDMDGYFNGAGVKIDYMSGILTNGITIDSENGIVITRSDNLVRTRLNAIDGISIEQFINGNWKKKFYADINGQFYADDLIARRLRIVNSLDDIFLDVDTSYLNIGRFETIITDGKLTPLEKLTLKSEWERIQVEHQKILAQAEEYKTSSRDSSLLINIPPFVSAYTALGNYIAPLLANMEEVTPVDRNQFKTVFNQYYDEARRIINEITDALKYSSLQLGEPYNNVTIDATTGILIEKIGGTPVQTILNATEGITIQRLENGLWTKKFFVDTNGILNAIDLIAERLILRGKNGELLLDANENLIDFNNFDMILGTLTASEILASMITADTGFISNLTANRLQTSPMDVESGYGDYIKIVGKEAKWITGRAIGSGTHVRAPDNSPLYWKDAQRSGITLDNTGFPVMQYDYEEIERLVIGFKGSGIGSYPFTAWGVGDGGGNDTTFEAHGKGYLWKDVEGFVWRYNARNNGRLREIKMDDTGMYIDSELASVGIDARDILINSDNGQARIEHSSGSYIEITPSGNINIHSTGNVNITGTRIDFN